MRCLTSEAPAGPPCGSAFAALTVREQAPAGQPRVLHLQEPRFGLAFDAPDDEWLAVGPRSSGGRSQTWTWTKRGRRIDLSIIDFLGKVAITLDDLARRTGARLGVGATSIKVTSEQHVGRPVARLVVERGAKGHEETVFQRRGTLVFALAISTPAPEPELVERVLAGLRIDDATP
ncbi:MAG TPA: hypothetical protein VHJ20_01895 [Polyangia bacterium]|nr:hypothetical protein [Polyangia bacterium]